MTSRRAFAIPGLALLLCIACVTTPPPKPVRPALADTEPADAEPVEVTRGTVTALGAVGGDTGVRTAWFRLHLDRPGDAKVALRVYDPDELLTLTLYDAAVIHRGDADPSAMEYLLTRSPDKAIETTLAAGDYYVKVGTGLHSAVAEFDLDVSFSPELPQRVAEVRPFPVVPDPDPPQPSPPPPPKRVDPPREPRVVTPRNPTPPPPKTPIIPPPSPKGSEPPPVPVIPPPPVRETLQAPSRATANRLRGGDNFFVPIGADSGLRWQWFEVTMVRKGKLMLDFTTNGAPTEVMLTNIDGKPLTRMNIVGSGSHNAIYDTGKIYVRVGPTSGDIAALVQVQAKIVIAGTIHDP